jgi:hypothetical protein
MRLFMKGLKQRFGGWHNRRRGRKGTLWEERCKSVPVENGQALVTMATYIDLNPVRAGLMEDPREYRRCRYAAAVAGKRRARRGLKTAMATWAHGETSEAASMENARARPEASTMPPVGGRQWLNWNSEDHEGHEALALDERETEYAAHFSRRRWRQSP